MAQIDADGKGHTETTRVARSVFSAFSAPLR
jgi:hypothetical protein